MVYESGFTTRRTYSSRPVVTSYSVSYPTLTKVSRVYKTSFPIYSTSSYTRGTRVISSPVRVITSPTRVITRVIRSPSPVRIIRSTTTRTITSPERVTSYSYSSPYTSTYTSNYIPSTYISSYTPSYISPYTPSSYVYTSPSYLYSPISRVYTRSLSPVRVTSSSVHVTPSYLKRTVPGYGARALTNYLSTEPFTTFREETGRIRHRAQSLIRDLHTPVVRRARSCTPFPVTGYEPASELALNAYVSRVTNPIRHIAKEVHRMSMYPEPARKYVDPELDPNRPSRKFSSIRQLEDSMEEDDEMKEKQRVRQERLLTVNEESDSIDLEKKRVQRADEAKQREQK